jgi:hypothetical protein
METESLRAELRDKIYGFWVSQCLHVAVELGIADCLRDGPKTSVELAERTRAHPGALYRLLRGLAVAGIVREEQGRRFGLTPVADLLRPEVAGSMCAEVRNVLHFTSWSSWGGLLHSVRTGKAAFPEIFGKTAWEHRSENPESRTIFDAMAAGTLNREGEAVLRHLDLSGVRQIVDVGGGRGELLAEMLRRQPNLRGVLFEQPCVVAAAQGLLGAAGVADRCRIEAGDFFDRVPTGGDLYLLKAVIHNWNDEAATAILANCRRAMSRHARIVIAEAPLDPAKSSIDSLMDLHMLVVHGGQERTEAELGELLSSSGFRMKSALTTDAGISLIEGEPQ